MSAKPYVGWAIDCDTCGDETWDSYDGDGIPVFEGAPEDVAARLQGGGWTAEIVDGVFGRLVCDDCTVKEFCANNGHQWLQWYQPNPDFPSVFRDCKSCHADEESLPELIA